jgi:hypothetical protein
LRFARRGNIRTVTSVWIIAGVFLGAVVLVLVFLMRG